MEKPPSLPPRPSISSLTSATSSQTSLRPRHFQYDVLTANKIRLFRLDLNSEEEPLSGSLLTTYLMWDALDMSKNSWVSLFQEDTKEIMRRMTDDDEYDTFSYCWGDQRETSQLQVSVVSNKAGSYEVLRVDIESHRNGFINIGSNLRSLLEELRRRKHTRFVWIDAICINQANDIEKRMQIPLMRDVFQYAGGGYVWLGQASFEETMAMRMLPAVAERLYTASTNKSLIIPGKEETFTGNDIPSSDSNFWSALRKVLSNPWWSRLWTLQEVVYTDRTGQDGSWSSWPPTPVYVGNTATDLNVFNQLNTAAASLGIRSWIMTGQSGVRADTLYAFNGLDEIRICRDTLEAGFGGMRLRALLVGTRRRRATVDADMVYGMLAMMDRHIAKLLAPEANSTAQEVFVKFAKYYIRNEHREHLFSHTSTENRMIGLPSWCPNFASAPAAVSLGTHWFGWIENSEIDEKTLFHAGYKHDGKWKLPRSKSAAFKGIANVLKGRSVYHEIHDTHNRRQITLVPDSDYLLVSGIHMDFVVDVIDANPSARATDIFSLQSLLLTEEWEMKCLNLAKEHAFRNEDESDDLDAYVRTLVTNRTAVEPPSSGTVFFDKENEIDFVKHYHLFKDFIEISKSLDGEIDAENNLDRDTWHFMDVMSHVSCGRKFFATEGGRIGLGPSTTEVGDVIRVLFYCPTPYVIRHHPNGRGQLLGEAYIHGLMYGEALDMLDSDEVDETQWVLE